MSIALNVVQNQFSFIREALAENGYSIRVTHSDELITVQLVDDAAQRAIEIFSGTEAETIGKITLMKADNTLPNYIAENIATLLTTAPNTTSRIVDL